MDWLPQLSSDRRVLWLRAADLLRWGIAFGWSALVIMVAAGAVRLPRSSGSWVFAFIASIFAIGLLSAWIGWQRERHIREAPLPQFLKRKLRESYPTLLPKDCDLVERGLRQFFLACARSRGQFVAMPSRVVDTMWHEFILHTRAYDGWCRVGLGRFLHHTPAEALGGDARRNDGLRRAWFWACRDEAIDPRTPTRLPLLFALDAKLAIPGGFQYVADCSDIARKSEAGGDGGQVYCGTGFSDASSGSGDADGFGGSDGSSDGGDGGCGGD